jgi:hypothetical protein
MQVVPSTTILAVRETLFSTEEELALIGFLAGYGGLTREAYQLDLRQYVSWCTERGISLFGARRADIERFGRTLESRGRARATIARRLCTVACFYRYAEEEGMIAVSPAVHVRRPRLDYESHATGLDRNEVGAMLVAAGLGNARDHALISLLALNGLRVSEAIGADVERLGVERGHRTLTVLRKGGKIVTVPLRRAPPGRSTSRLANVQKGRSSAMATVSDSIDTQQLAWSSASRVGLGSPNGLDLTRCGMRSSPPRSTPGCRCATSKKPPATRIRAPRCATTVLECRSIGTRPTSLQRSSREQPGSPPAQRHGSDRVRWSRLVALVG